MALVTEPIALDRSLNTTELTPRNLADVLAQALQILNTTISGLNFINCVVVPSLPTTGISTTTIYLVPKSPTQQDNVYDEYINLDGTVNGWEKIGDTEIDLSNYYTKTETDTLLGGKVDKVNGKGLSTNDYTDTEKAKLAGIEANAEVNVQSDWNEADNTADDYIKNKPSSEVKSATDTFTTVNGGLLEECNIELVPVQDLHGYDNPWVGGSRKNKLPLVLADIKSANTLGTWSGNVYTYCGIDITILSDNGGNITAIKANNTATGEVTFFIPFAGITAGNYYANGCPDGGSNNTFDVYFWNSTTNARVKKWDGTTDSTSIYNSTSSAEIQVPNTNDNLQYRIRIRSGYIANNLMFYPMIRFATESDPTFEPYSNICPINGHTEVDLDVKDGDNVTQQSYQVQIGSTVYGGTVDLVSGVMTVDRAIATYSSINNVVNINNNRTLVQFPAIGNIALENYSNDYLCDEFGIATASSNTDTIGSYYYNTTFRIRCPEDWGTTNPQISAKLANNPVSFCYPLATPFTIQLTPQQIKTLVGENNLSTPLDGQSIDSVKYREVFAFDDVEKVVSLRVPISMLGTDESGRTTASQSYASGDYFYKDGYMCKALTSISAGATLTLNTNYSQGTLADILKAIENA